MVGVGLTLFAIKVVAWWLTDSVAVLTDAMESTVNVVAGFIGLYSLYLSAKPRDREHPYGHGKVEFISAGIEGALITIAGILIVYEALKRLQHPESISNLDMGIVLVAISAVANFVVGWLAIRQGRKNNSLALVASGSHLQSDTWTTAGIVVGLLLLDLTGWLWIDSVVAILFALVIIFTGYRIVRRSIAGVMDEADEKLLKQLVHWLQKHRRENWIDIHNLRIIKYGSVLHLDFHLTVPWYLNVRDAHQELDTLAQIVQQEFGNSVEMFVHTDPCRPNACPICQKKNCPERQKPFVKTLDWNVDNLSSNERHSEEDLQKASH